MFTRLRFIILHSLQIAVFRQFLCAYTNINLLSDKIGFREAENFKLMLELYVSSITPTGVA